MIADVVSAGNDVREDGSVGGGDVSFAGEAVPDHEEGRRHAELLEGVEDQWRGGCVWTVVEGEGDVAGYTTAANPPATGELLALVLDGAGSSLAEVGAIEMHGRRRLRRPGLGRSAWPLGGRDPLADRLLLAQGVAPPGRRRGDGGTGADRHGEGGGGGMAELAVQRRSLPRAIFSSPPP